jgi:hypothetical protein
MLGDFLGQIANSGSLAKILEPGIQPCAVF